VERGTPALAEPYPPAYPGGSMRSLRPCRPGWRAAVTLLLAACAVAPSNTGAPPSPISVSGHSYNRSDMEVYLLCGNRNARWLGVVSKKGAAAFEIPAEAARCGSGLNFFLAARDRGRGYWAGPVRPRAGEEIDLVIEKYAGLSTARVRGNFR
jgi:hypothetical protein